MPAICFVCKQSIEEMLTPVFAKIHLHRPLVVYTTRDRTQYLGTLRTLPVAHLCPGHSPLFDVEKPWLIHWPIMARDFGPGDIING